MKKKTIIITGASKGLGKEFLKLLVKEDCDQIWAVARKSDALLALPSEFGDKVIPVVADLSKMEDILGIQKRLEQENPDVTWLVNNAGYGKFGGVEDISLQTSMNMIDLDVKAVVALSVICLPYMNSGAHILNVASLASVLPIPYMNIYAACKVFVRNYTRALNVELKDRGISAMALCPGWMETDFLKTGKTDAKKAANNFEGASSAAPVARKAIEKAKAGKDILYPGFQTKAVRTLAQLVPPKWAMKAWLLQQHIHQ